MPFINEYVDIFIVVNLSLLLLFIVIFIVMTVRYKALRKSYLSMLRSTNTPDLEQVIIKIHDDIAQLQAKQSSEKRRVDDIIEAMKGLKANLGVHRYKAYDQHASDLSFSIAIVDDYSNGVVLTGLHSREETFIYAKALEHGDSKHALSPEEKIAINQAVSKGKA